MCMSAREKALFLKSKTKETDSGCWEWQGPLYKGYSRVARSIHPSRIGSRAMYEAVIGPIPKGRMVCHSCDNPACINPEHLWYGTNKENQDDKIAKGRARGGSLPNEKNPCHKFTLEDVEQMRFVWPHFGGNQAEMARAFNISHSHLNHILRRKARTIGAMKPVAGEINV